MSTRLDARYHYDWGGSTSPGLNEEEPVTTEADPVPLLLEPAPRRSRIAHAVMRFATRINWAEPELRGLAAVVRPGDHVFDVGAAHGMYTLPFADLVGPGGRVHAFEPHPRQQRQLRVLRRLLGLDQVDVNAAAVGAEPGEQSMTLPYRFLFPIYGHAHVTKGAAIDPSRRTRSWRTPVTTVDEVCAREEIDEVAFIKVDVEGFEPRVIEGAAKAIDRSRPSLLLEIEDRHLARYGRDANHFADELRSRWPEYGMYTWVDEQWVATERIGLGTRNYLFATALAFARP
jgi:FkbM family methyltransferase